MNIQLSSRSATFTTDKSDEVMLNYLIEAGESSQLHGQKGVAFYETKQYREKQAKHGIEIYPEPALANFA